MLWIGRFGVFLPLLAIVYCHIGDTSSRPAYSYFRVTEFEMLFVFYVMNKIVLNLQDDNYM